MKAFALLFAVAAATVSAYSDEDIDEISSDITAIPPCGYYCFHQVAQETGCKDENDIACVCNNLTTFMNNMHACECTYCTLSDVATSNTQFALDHLCPDLQAKPELVPLAASYIAANVSTAEAETTRTEDICAKGTDVPSTTYSIPVAGGPVKTTSSSAGHATSTTAGSSSSHAAGSSHGSPSATPSSHSTPVANAAMKAGPVLAAAGAAFMAGIFV